MDFLELGYLGLFLATFLAATVIPFSSEVVLAGMISAGFSPVSVIIVASIGNTFGGVSSFYLGYLGKWYWIETKLKVPKQKVLGLKHWLDKYGYLTAFFCWFPFVGDVLAIALGFFRLRATIIFPIMFLGKFLRYVVVVWLWQIV